MWVELHFFTKKKKWSETKQTYAMKRVQLMVQNNWSWSKIVWGDFSTWCPYSCVHARVHVVLYVCLFMWAGKGPRMHLNFVCVRRYMDVCVYIYVCTYVYIYKCVRVCVCIYVCTFVYIHIRVYVCVCRQVVCICCTTPSTGSSPTR